MNNLVSVITPAYNAERFIGETIESVISQDYKDWEMIIVNDCSKDSTEDIIKNYLAKDNRIKLISLDKNGGVANARNTAIQNAKGRYLAFLDSDDLWKYDKLSKHTEIMKEKGYSFTYSNYEMIGEDGVPLNKIYKAPKELDYKKALFGNSMGCLTVVIDRQRAGDPFMSPIGHEDYVAWLNILKKGIKAYNVGGSLAYYRVSKGSLSSNKIRAAKWTWTIYREEEKINIIKSIILMSSYAINALRKRY